VLRCSLFGLALAALAALAITDRAAAQVSRVPNSGCRNSEYPTPVGNPAIGQGFGAICPECRPGHTPFVLVGTAPANLAIRPPAVCTATPCVLATRPEILLFGSSAWRVVIPNDPRLIGLCFYVQCGCADPREHCITLSGALQVCITR
jgi:hypothetical protein